MGSDQEPNIYFGQTLNFSEPFSNKTKFGLTQNCNPVNLSQSSKTASIYPNLEK